MGRTDLERLREFANSKDHYLTVSETRHGLKLSSWMDALKLLDEAVKAGWLFTPAPGEYWLENIYGLHKKRKLHL